MKPDHVEIIGEIAGKCANAIFFHEGVKELGVWLPLMEIEVSRDDPIPGLVTVRMPASMAAEHGFSDSEVAV